MRKTTLATILLLGSSVTANLLQAAPPTVSTKPGPATTSSTAAAPTGLPTTAAEAAKALPSLSQNDRTARTRIYALLIAEKGGAKVYLNDFYRHGIHNVQATEIAILRRSAEAGTTAAMADALVDLLVLGEAGGARAYSGRDRTYEAFDVLPDDALAAMLNRALERQVTTPSGALRRLSYGNARVAKMLAAKAADPGQRKEIRIAAIRLLFRQDVGPYMGAMAQIGSEDPSPEVREAATENWYHQISAYRYAADPNSRASSDDLPPEATAQVQDVLANPKSTPPIRHAATTALYWHGLLEAKDTAPLAKASDEEIKFPFYRPGPARDGLLLLLPAATGPVKTRLIAAMFDTALIRESTTAPARGSPPAVRSYESVLLVCLTGPKPLALFALEALEAKSDFVYGQGEGVMPVLQTLLGHPDVDIRRAAARAAVVACRTWVQLYAGSDRSNLVEAISASAPSETDPAVRALYADALSATRKEDPDVTAALRTLAADADPGVAARAFEALRAQLIQGRVPHPKSLAAVALHAGRSTNATLATAGQALWMQIHPHEPFPNLPRVSGIMALRLALILGGVLFALGGIVVLVWISARRKRAVAMPPLPLPVRANLPETITRRPPPPPPPYVRR